MAVEVKGVADLRKTLAKIAQAAPGALGAALYQEGLAIDALAVQKCPVDTGRLRATHYVAPPVNEGGRVSIEVGFGTDYAIYVHERNDLRHTTGEYKFLEKALNERMAGYFERLAARVKQNLEKGVSAVPLSAPTSPRDPGAAWQESKRRSKRKAVKRAVAARTARRRKTRTRKAKKKAR